MKCGSLVLLNRLRSQLEPGFQFVSRLYWRLNTGAIATSLVGLMLVISPKTYANFVIDLSRIPNELQEQVLPKRELSLLKKGEKITMSMSEIDSLLAKFFETGAFRELGAKRAGGSFQIAGELFQNIKEITTQGNKILDDDEVIELFGLLEGRRFDPALASQGVNRIAENYFSKGYLNAQVELETSQVDASNNQVTLIIREGEICRVKEVYLVTSNTDVQKQLLKEVEPQLGSSYTGPNEQEIADSLMDYLRENRYLTAKLKGPEVKMNEAKTQASLVYTLEDPYQFLIRIEGNKGLDDSLLMKSLKLDESEQLGTNPGAEMANRLMQTYHYRGYASAQIDFKEQVFSQEFIRRIIFNVSEGTIIRLGKIEISGAQQIEEKWYLDFIKDNNDDVQSSNYFSRTSLDKSLERLVVSLQNRGFLQAKINSWRAELVNKETRANIFISIYEGPQTFVKSVSFVGAQGFDTSVLTEVTDLRVGEPLNLKTLEESLDRLRTHYNQAGYLDMTVKDSREELIVYSSSNKESTITYRISEGPQVQVASILIEGNEITKDYVIRKELEFEVGDILTPDKITDSQYRLQRLGLFRQISIRTLEQGTNIAERTVVVKVVDRDPGLFQFGVGANTEFELTLRGYTGIAYRNIGGTARGLSARAEVSRVADIPNFTDHRITAGYLEPFIFDTRTRGRLNFTRDVSLVARRKTENLNLAREISQFDSLLEYEFTRHLRFSWSAYSVAFIKDFDVDSKTQSSENRIASVGPSIELDYRDHPFITRKGTLSRFNLEYASPEIGSSENVNYVRLNGAFNFYVPLFAPRLVWANSLRGGYVAHLLDRGSVPDQKIFYLGGRASIRGFDVQAIPPGGTVTPLRAAEIRIPVRVDSHFYVVQSELRFPIYKEVEGVLFYDGGQVRITGYDFDDDYRDAAGLGFRLNTPVGPVSLEYGYKLDRKNNESEGRIHFFIGTF